MYSLSKTKKKKNCKMMKKFLKMINKTRETMMTSPVSENDEEQIPDVIL